MALRGPHLLGIEQLRPDEITSILDLAAANLISPIILSFALGVAAARELLPRRPAPPPSGRR